MNRKVFISAGEASGDLHLAGLVSELKKLDPGIDFRGLGGDRLIATGASIDFHVSDLAAMGFTEVLRKYPFFRKVLRAISDQFESDPPDAAILVDYPGMNFRFAERLNRLGIPTVYYILPQVWAWHRSRIKKMQRWNAKLVSILPFEPEFFSEHGLEVEYYGHPLVDLVRPETAAEEFRDSVGVNETEELIAVLPGSRVQEVCRILPPALSSLEIAREKLGSIRAFCRPVDRKQNDLYQRIIDNSASRAEVFNGNLYDLLQAADLTLVASGTATLEAAICKSPAIVLYRTSFLSYIIAKNLVRVDSIALANLITGEKIYPELIQSDVNPQRIAQEIISLLEEPGRRERMKARIEPVSSLLGEGNAYAKAAKSIHSHFNF